MNEQSGKARIKNWLDDKESLLAKEAESAGLLKHGSTVGMAREFLVQRMLKNILPPAIHVGTGTIIGSSGIESKQIDVIIYDPRFPVLSMDYGSAIYLVEGVIAAIEVKSSLDKKSLEGALENCLSVFNVQPELDTSRADSTKRAELLLKRGHADNEIDELIKRGIAPQTYILGFRKYKKDLKAITKVVDDWYEAKGRPGSQAYHCLPRAIVTQGLIGVSPDDIFRITNKDIDKEIKAQHGADAAAIMLFARSEHRLGNMACCLMMAVTRRMGAHHIAWNVPLNYEHYLPVELYIEDMQSSPYQHYLVRKS